MKQKIIIFGGSFDPIHNAHLYIAKHAIKKNKSAKAFFCTNLQWYF
ncbi:adenylyltransferase/cytidyltransferase family protein [Mycoplasmoides genitalium]|nr:adenylyltransferase/cytidyltransferase family protein [Mycoplasmoides genitalium]